MRKIIAKLFHDWKEGCLFQQSVLLFISLNALVEENEFMEDIYLFRKQSLFTIENTATIMPLC